MPSACFAKFGKNWFEVFSIAETKDTEFRSYGVKGYSYTYLRKITL